MRAVIFAVFLFLAGRDALAHPQDRVPAPSPQLAERDLLCLVACGTPLLPNLCTKLCEQCAAPRTFCEKSKTCADCKSDGDNCGACGNKCGAGYTCCNSKCVEKSAFSKDAENCGSCNHKCPTGDECRKGTCVPPDGNTCQDTGAHSLRSLFRTCQSSGSACGKGAKRDCDCAKDVKGNPFCGVSGKAGSDCERRCSADKDCWKGEVCGDGAGCCDSGVWPRHGGKKGVCVKVCG